MMKNRFMTDLDFTKTQLAVYWVIILLSVENLNPVHIVCKALTPWIEPWHFAALSATLLLYLCMSQLKDVLYFGVRAFFHSILSIFFKQVEVVGLENIPRYGPVLFTINHANQFIDAVTVLSTCQRKISYLMAEASFQRRVIGDIAWAMDVVPVKRAQDEAKKGPGTITLKLQQQQPTPTQGEDAAADVAEAATATATATATADAIDLIEVTGTATQFQQLKPGDKIRPVGTPFGFKVVAIESDTALTVDGTGRPEHYVLPNNDNTSAAVAYDILAKVDTHIVFEKVLDRLASGGAVGIFPEGGSHDRTELLPLKVGIALIAYSALDKDNLLVPIVPVGLNYFRAHRWRGKAVIEYGRPTTIDVSTLPKYKAGGAQRRQVCNALLEDIERSMKSVIVQAPDYETLQLIHTARRLWQRKKGTLDVQEKQDLTRRFAQGYQLLMQNDNPPPNFDTLQLRLKEYHNTLKEMGLRDYQVPALTEEHLEQSITIQNPNQILQALQLSYQILHLLFLICIAAIPFILINFPVGILAGLYAERRRVKALAKSKVKIKGYDVMLTEKVVFCIVVVPTLWMFYAFLLITFTNWEYPTIALCMGCLPLFAYMGIVAAEAGMVDWNDLRPFVMRLSPAARKRLAALPKQRKELQDDLRAFVKEVGPKYLADLYAVWEKQGLYGGSGSGSSSSSTLKAGDAAEPAAGVVVDSKPTTTTTTTTISTKSTTIEQKKDQ